MKESKGHGLYEICNEYRERDQVGLSHLLQEEEEEEGRGMNKNNTKKKLNYGEYIQRTDGWIQPITTGTCPSVYGPLYNPSCKSQCPSS